MSTWQIITKRFKAATVAGIISLLIACGGGGTSGSTSQPVVASGVITDWEVSGLMASNTKHRMVAPTQRMTTLVQ